MIIGPLAEVTYGSGRGLGDTRLDGRRTMTA